MISDPRPLSPHLQIYRWQLTSVLSILHRMTGIALAVGAILFVSWIGAAADGPEPYAKMQWFLGSWIGLLLLFGWTLSLFYHLCNGIRHLVWDTGHALDLESTYLGGWIVVGATAALTLVAWIAGIAREVTRHGLCLVVPGADRGQPPHVGSCAEAAPCAGDHDSDHAAIVLSLPAITGVEPGRYDAKVGYRD